MAEIQGTKCLMDNYKPNPIEPIRTREDLPAINASQQGLDIIYIIQETLASVGIYGEENTQGLISALKRLGRYDLLTPCCRE